MSRLKKAFLTLEKNHQKAFIPYIMAGDGGLDQLIEKLIFLEKKGATAIEIGVPFSDPVADGPTIQNAGIRALKEGTTLKQIIEKIARARKKVSIPLLLMTYLNPIYSYGIQRFAEDIKNAGVDGCIIPDLPLEEEGIVEPFLMEANIDLIRLVTLTTPRERLEVIAQKGNGFLYAVTIKGITGARNSFNDNLEQFLKKVKEVSPIPVLAGFGISDERQMKNILNHCDGVIVGSKIIDLFQTNDLLSIEKLMAAIQI